MVTARADTHVGAHAPSTVLARAVAAAPVGLAAALGGLVAAWAAFHVVPNGSYNLDELVYLNQAEAIRHGQVTYDADAYVPDFRPYLSGVAGDQVVFKYQPLWPAWLAVSQAATGDHRPGLVVAGVAAAVAFWLLGRELTGRAWLGTALAAGVTASPLFVVHSATALAYLPTATLAAAFLATVLRGVRTASGWWFAAAGLALGALLFHRPFDAALVAAPVAVWLAARAARAGDWRAPAAVALAAAPFAVAWLGYNLATTGDVLTPAFSVDAPSDTFGFGRRASWEATGETFVDGGVDFTPARATRTLVTFTAVTPLWIAGGAVSLALMAAAMVIGRRDVRRWILLSTMVLAVVAYYFWWGATNFVDFGLHTSLGPAYWLVALGPAAGLVVLGAQDAVGAVRDHPHRRRLIGAGVVGFGVMSVPGAVYAGVHLDDARDARADQLELVGAAPPGTLLLFPTGVNDPFLRVLVPADLDATARLHAVDLESVDQRFRLRDRFPDRPLWVWVQDRPAGTMLDPPRGYQLGEIPEARVPEAVIDTAVRAGGGRITAAWLRTLDGGGAELDRQEMDPSADPRPAAARAVGSRRLDGGSLVIGPDPGWLAAGVTVAHPDGRAESVEVRWMVRARGGQLDVIGPGLGYRLYEFPDATDWMQEDVSGRLTADLGGLPAFAPVRQTDPFE